jgi:type II secretory pathway pseudopilin PulG
VSRLRREDGISMVAAIGLMSVVLMLGVVAVQKAVSGLQRTDRDLAVKTSLQSADAALDAAVYQLNRVDLGGTINIDPQDPGALGQQFCPASASVQEEFEVAELSAGAGVDAQGRKWCPPVTETVGNTTFEFRVSSLVRVGDTCGEEGRLSLRRDVVAVGTTPAHTHPIRRRLYARMNAAVALLSGAAVQASSADDPLTMSGLAAVAGDVHSNNSITGPAVPTATITGDAIPGPGDSVSGVIVAGGVTTPACQRFQLPLVAQGDAPATNDNGAWASGCVNTLTLLPSACTNLAGTPTGGVVWSAGTRELRVWGNGRLILTGGTYSFCRLRLEGQSILQVASGATARIFLDDPGDCGAVAGAGEVTMDGSSRMVNCNASTRPETFQLYAVGSDTAATSQTLAGGGPLAGALLAATCGLAVAPAGTPMMLYAPRSTVTLGNATSIAGQVAGYTVGMSGSARVAYVAALININALGSKAVLPLYRPTDYVECTAVGFSELPENDPTYGC